MSLKPLVPFVSQVLLNSTPFSCFRLVQANSGQGFNRDTLQGDQLGSVFVALDQLIRFNDGQVVVILDKRCFRFELPAVVVGIGVGIRRSSEALLPSLGVLAANLNSQFDLFKIQFCADMKLASSQAAQL